MLHIIVAYRLHNVNIFPLTISQDSVSCSQVVTRLRKNDLTTKDIGDKIRARRQHLKLSQLELAERFGVHRVTLSQYERGEREIGSTDIPRLASILGVSIVYFFGDEEDVGATEIEYEPILDELRTAGYSGGLDDGDVEEIAEIIRMKAKRRAKKRGA